jgi:enoyl-CoA hydratase/carnithine racemase
MEMLLTGRPIEARTALDWGLVNRVVPASQLDDAINEFVDVIAARSPATIRMGKSAFYAQVDRQIAAAYDVASETMTANMLLDDASEGIDAFLGKRAAVWSGR